MSQSILSGKRGLIVGVANQDSIAWGCARAMREAGAELAITYLNAKAEPYVRPLAEQVDAPIVLPLDVRNPGELESVFDHIARTWGTLDFVIHSIAFANAADLNGRVVDASREGFLEAMDVSCHSFLRMAKLAEPLMPQGGSLLTLSYHGGEKVIKGYNMMGPVKAALESCVRYMAVDLGPQRIRVNAISAGLVATRAGKGIGAFSDMFARYEAAKPLPSPLTIDDVGYSAAFLASDGAKSITGAVHFVDAGYHITD
jgi:enoyl-[acyl-carrier protein] reductase I